MLQPRMTVKVSKKIREAEGIAVFELTDPQGADLPPFSAGAHIDVEIQPGLVRQYSLCNNPSERDRYMVGVLLDTTGRGGSAAMHALVEGQAMRISEPRNHFQLDGDARRTRLFAGGIGVTPLLCMAERLAATRADFEMHYAARSLSRCAFHERIVRSSFADRVYFHFDDGDDAQKLNIEQALGRPDPGLHIYVCGPSGFIDFVLRASAASGFPESQVHCEYFTADSAAIFAEGGAFQVRLASSGETYDVPADRTIMEVLHENGFDLPVSCEQGVCGTCLTRVLEGIPEHRDHYLNYQERELNDLLTPCCSRSKTPLLVLDI